MTWALAVSGAVALLAQVVLLRECQVTAFGSELVLVLGLGVWLLGAAAGAASGAGRVTRRPAGGVGAAFVGLALLVPAATVLARGARRLFGAVPGGDLPPARLALAVALCLVPVSFVLGRLFRRAARRHAAEGGTLAGAYALESAGGLLGGTLATLLPACGVSNLRAALLCGLLALAGAWPGARRSRAWIALPAVALVALLAWPGLDAALTRWNHPGLLATRDTPYGRVTVEGAPGQVAVFEDDALAYESQGAAAEPFVHVAAAQRGRVGRVLVLGGAVQGLLPELLAHRPGLVDDVELDARVLATIRPWLPGPARRALDDPRVQVQADDPRRFLARAGRYDLVLDAMPEPSSGRANRYFTREFFAACAAHLAPGGVLALRLPGAENLWTAAQAARAAGIERALREVFPATLVLPGATDLFLASSAPLPHDPAVVSARIEARGVRPRLVTAPWVRYLYTNDRVPEAARRLARADAAANRDARPLAYPATLLLWASRYSPALAGIGLPVLSAGALARSPWTWAGLAALVLAARLARRGNLPRRALLAGAAGLAGMLLESALLLGYQTRSGVLWQDLGVLLTAFMAGLAVGAWLAGALVAAARGAHGVAAATCLALAALAALCAALGASAGLAATAALLFATGALVAGAFACAVAPGFGARRATRARTDPGAALVGPVYAADLAGGCLAAMLAGLVTIPLAGLPETALLAGVVAFLALLVA